MKPRHLQSLVGASVFCLFAMSLQTGAQTYQELYSFSRAPDGAVPHGGLVEGEDSYFYGTTFYGGLYDQGSIFKINPQGSLTIVASFDGTNSPRNPSHSLLLASDGNFYGDYFKAAPDGALSWWPIGGSAGELVQGTSGYAYGVDAGYDWFYRYF